MLQTTAALGVTSVAGCTDLGFWGPSAGEEKWEFTSSGDRPGSGFFSSPTVVDGTVYIGGPGALYALDAATGDEEWTFTDPSHVVRSSPTVSDGTVYVGGPDETLYAVDAETGEREWVFTEPSRIVRSSPTVFDGTVYVGADGLYAVDGQTGEREWRFDESFGWTPSSPTVFDETVYILFTPSTDPEHHEFGLFAVDAATGEREWAFTGHAGIRSTHTSSPTVADGTVYVGAPDETLYAVDAATGEREWAFTEPAMHVSSSPTVFDGTVYVGAVEEWEHERHGDPDAVHSGLYAIDAETGEREWMFPTDEVLNSSSPTVAGGVVYVGSNDQRVGVLDGAMYAVDAETGEQVWKFTEPPDGVGSSPTVVDGTVYFGASGTTHDYDGAVFAVNAGVDGSSAGSRVRLGTLGHHDEAPRN